MEELLAGEKTLAKLAKSHLVHRFKENQEIESMFALNNFKFFGIKLFSREFIDVYEFDADKKPYFFKKKEVITYNSFKGCYEFKKSKRKRERKSVFFVIVFLKVSLGYKSISKVEEYNLNLNNTAYVLREICF